jgi:hypothetical protein
LRGLARHVFGDQRQRHKDDRAGQRGDADQGMEGKADREIERQPRQIEERARSLAAEEGADVVEVVQRLQPFVAHADQKRQPHHGLEHALVECFIERGPYSPEDAPADQIEHALRGVEAGSENDKANKGRHAATWQHAVVDFQHEDGAGKIQQVNHKTHQAHADERAAATPQRITEFGRPDVGKPWHRL